MTADRVTWEFPPRPDWVRELLGESVSRPEAEVRRALGMPPSPDKTLAVDAAVAGLCPCGVDPRPGSAYCSPDCEPTHRGPDTDAWGSGPLTAARWRPDLVTAFDDSDLTLTQEVAVRGLNRCWYARTDGRRFLRLDDGHRFVGAWAPEDGPPDGLWDRLERELGDRRRIAPDSAVAPGTYTARGTLPPQITGVGRVSCCRTPPADPEAPTVAELAGGVDLTPYLARQLRVNLRVSTRPPEEGMARASEAFRRAVERFVGFGRAATVAVGALTPATQRAIQAAAEAESDRVALRAVCADEAMYERALAEVRSSVLSVRQMADAVAAGRYTEEGGIDGCH